jgi:hypothetical protein
MRGTLSDEATCNRRALWAGSSSGSPFQRRCVRKATAGSGESRIPSIQASITFVDLRLTAAAYAHGLALALPDNVAVARPRVLDARQQPTGCRRGPRRVSPAAAKRLA